MKCSTHVENRFFFSRSYVCAKEKENHERAQQEGSHWGHSGRL